MTTYDNTNRFALFVNDRKGQDRDPDYTGTLNVDGVEYFIDGWKRQTQGGKVMLSGRIKRKQPRPNASDKPAPASRYSDLDDSIPF